MADPGFSFGRGGAANPKVGVFSGGSRIFLRRGHQLIFQIFCRKLHENVPLDPPMLSKDQKILAHGNPSQREIFCRLSSIKTFSHLGTVKWL